MLIDFYPLMFFVLSIVIFFVGRAIGWLALSLAMGRAVLMKENVAPKSATVLWAVASLALSALLCYLYPGWTFSLPD